MPTSATLTLNAEPRETAALAYLLQHAARELSVTTVWQSLIFRPESTAEMRRSVVAVPSRRVTHELFADGPSELQSLRMFFARLGTQRQLMPLMRDLRHLTAGAASSATSISVDTTLSAYAEGVQCVVFKRPSAGVLPTSVVVTIDSLNDTSLTFTSTLGTAFDAGDAVCPLMSCEVVPSMPQPIQHGVTPQARARVESFEIVGEDALPAASTPGDLPSGFTSYGDGDGALPILDADAYREKPCRGGFIRYGSLVSAGFGQLPDLDGDRPSARFALPVAGLTRDECWALVRFFDSRAGRTHPFWLVSGLCPYTLTAVNSTTELVMEANGVLDDWAYRPFLSLRLDDGSIVVRGVSAVSRNDAETLDTVTLSSALSSAPAASEVVQCAQAFKARFDRDDFPTTWTKTTTMRGELAAVELPVEKSFTIADLTTISTLTLCVNGDTSYASDATLSIQEDGVRDDAENTTFQIIANDLPMVSCGEFAGPVTSYSGLGTFVPTTARAVYSGSGTWDYEINDISDDDFDEVTIAGTGGVADVQFTAGDGGVSTVDFTITGAT